MSDEGPSTAWCEDIPPGEAEQIGGFMREVNRLQCSFARRTDGRARRGFHVKSHTALRAQFRVMDDLPAEARHGVFEAPRVFPAWVRISNGFSKPLPDWFPDLMGFAVKLQGVEGDKLLPEDAGVDVQDFLALNQPYVPVSDAQQMVTISTASGNVLTAPFVILHKLGLAHGLQVIGWTVAWSLPRIVLKSAVVLDFHSLTPITLGPYAVKFKWVSRQDKRPLPTPGASWLNYLRAELHARLRAGDLRYDFMAQFYRDPLKTPIDGALAWGEQDAPFVKLGELTIARCDLDGEQARADERHLTGLSFNPWHGLVAHRPIGNIQRARRRIYQGSARYSGRDPSPVE